MSRRLALDSDEIVRHSSAKICKRQVDPAETLHVIQLFLDLFLMTYYYVSAKFIRNWSEFHRKSRKFVRKLFTKFFHVALVSIISSHSIQLGLIESIC